MSFWHGWPIARPRQGSGPEHPHLARGLILSRHQPHDLCLKFGRRGSLSASHHRLQYTRLRIKDLHYLGATSMFEVGHNNDFPLKHEGRGSSHTYRHRRDCSGPASFFMRKCNLSRLMPCLRYFVVILPVTTGLCSITVGGKGPQEDPVECVPLAYVITLCSATAQYLPQLQTPLPRSPHPLRGRRIKYQSDLDVGRGVHLSLRSKADEELSMNDESRLKKLQDGNCFSVIKYTARPERRSLCVALAV